jgi:hypothetical protein
MKSLPLPFKILALELCFWLFFDFSCEPVDQFNKSIDSFNKYIEHLVLNLNKYRDFELHQ